MKCECCGIEHNGDYGSGRFCSYHCRCVYSGRHHSRNKKPRRSLNANKCKVSPIQQVPGTCQYCGEFKKSKASLLNHERLCRLNPNRDIKSLEKCLQNISHHNNALHNHTQTAWNKGLSATTDVRVHKYAQTLRKRYATGELAPTFKGHKHTTATKDKIRVATKTYISKTAGGPRYSLKACQYFDRLNLEKGWNLIHALNGGEFRVGRYSLDAYDSDRNIVVEYDEPKTHLKRLMRNSKDILRETHIKNMLGCKFFRYSEESGILYEV